MADKQKASGGGNRKKGRNRKWCEQYRVWGTREKNKRARLKRHVARLPDDKQAAKALAGL